MAHRIETITQHVFAFYDDEITTILNALYKAGHDELADEIFDELEGECECSQDNNGTVEDLIDAINKFTEGR